MYTHRRSIDWRSSSGDLFTKRSQQAEAEHEISIDIAAEATDMLVAFALDITQLKGFFMMADGDLEVCTNSASPGTDQFLLKANEPVHFLAGGDPAETNPFSLDVTALYVTNASLTTAVHLDIRALVDPVV